MDILQLCVYVRVDFKSVCFITIAQPQMCQTKKNIRKTIAERGNSHCLVNFFVNLLDRHLNVEFDGVEDVLEVGFLIHIKLQKR